MKLSRGMFMDSTEQDTPPGAYRYAKNIVDTNTIGSKENEDGFYPALDNDLTVIGIIPIEKAWVMFTVDGTDHQIVLVEKAADDNYTTTVIYNNSDLNFSVENPIKGEFKKELNGDRVISWIDDVNVPRILNIDDLSGVNDINDLALFQDVESPTMSFTLNNSGGALKSGAYIPITKYSDANGAETNWFIHDRSIYVQDDASTTSYSQIDGVAGNVATTKSIALSFTGCDTRYDTLVIGYIASNNGQLTYVKVREVPNSGTVNTIISGTETTEDLSAEEVLTATATYTNAKAITQLSNRLFLGNLTAADLPNFQPYANGIQINYSSSLVNVLDTSTKINGLGTFIPGEVYAFYIGLELNKGGWVFYHIPGRPGLPDGELAFTSGAGMSYYYYQVANTSNKTGVGATTNMGYWENLNETYPEDASFDGTSVGNEDLTGLGVRHHRMPTLDYLVNTTYAANPLAGVSYMPQLGIAVSNVIIPAEIQTEVKRWKIFYAKKSVSNSLFCGSDMLQVGATPFSDSSKRWGVGGNWVVGVTGASWESFSALTVDNIRGHCLDMLYSQNQDVPNYASFSYALTNNGLNTQYSGFGGGGGKLVVTGSAHGSNTGIVADFTNSSTTRSGALIIKRLDNFAFLPPNAVSGKFKTAFTEGCFVADINSPGADFAGIVADRLETNSGASGADDPPFTLHGGTEVTMQMQYMKILDNVHTSFMQQTLVVLTGEGGVSTTTSSCTGGDGFVSYLSFMTAGPNNSNPETTQTNPFEEGTRVWRAIAGYSRYNFNLRHQDAGSVDTYYYPKTDPREMFTPYVTTSGVTHTALFTLNDGVNNITYNEDYNKLQEYTVGITWNPDVVFDTAFPNKIIFSGSWQTFLVDDQTTIQTNRGEIINLQGIRNNELVVNTRYSAFRTRTDARQVVEGEDIFLKSANLFDLPMEELATSSAGYAGCQHKFACKLTKVGYAWVDDQQGKIFLYTGQLEEISSLGMRAFFRDFMKLVPDNENDNPFNFNGYNIEFDEKYNRLLVSKKCDVTGDNPSWTASYNPVTKTWISFHDYVPDYLFAIADGTTYALHDKDFYLVNPNVNINTVKGTYFDGTQFSSYIDVPYNPEPEVDKEFTGVAWISEVYPAGAMAGQLSTVLDYTDTCTHLTLRTLQHCTGRIQLSVFDDVNGLYDSNIRNLNRTWYFNDIRDISLATGFVTGFYNSYLIDSTLLNTNMEWYDQRRFIDRYAIVRYEYDNTSGNRWLFLDANIQYKYVAK